MQITSFDMTKVRWDAHRAFHIKTVHLESRARGHVTVTTFDTGEVMVDAISAGKALRGTYKAHQFTIFMPTDLDFEGQLTMPDGTRVPRAWLNTMLLHDHDTNHVVSLQRSTIYEPHTGGLIPPRLNRVGQVYFMGHKAAPQASCGIKVHRVVAPSTPEGQHLRTMTRAARLWCTLSSNDTYQAGDNYMPVGDVRAPRKALDVQKVLSAITLEDLLPAERLQLASFGVTYSIRPIVVSHLLWSAT
jgi:hypothetical protein